MTTALSELSTTPCPVLEKKPDTFKNATYYFSTANMPGNEPSECNLRKQLSELKANHLKSSGDERIAGITFLILGIAMLIIGPVFGINGKDLGEKQYYFEASLLIAFGYGSFACKAYRSRKISELEQKLKKCGARG